MKAFVFLIKPLLVSEALHSLFWPALGSSCQARGCPLSNESCSKERGVRPEKAQLHLHHSLLCLCNSPSSPVSIPSTLLPYILTSPRLTSCGVRDAQWVVPVVRASKRTWHFRQPPIKAIPSGTAPSLPALHRWVCSLAQRKGQLWQGLLPVPASHRNKGLPWTPCGPAGLHSG